MLWFALGLIALVVGAELLVRGASNISRWGGALFLALYVAYTLYLILHATGHDALQDYSAVMGGFVLPLLAVTLVVLALRHWRRVYPGNRS